jgi:hypothetical protein
MTDSVNKSKAAEACRLRAEGRSLRVIGKQLGVDEKQVRRWLKAAGDQAKPRRVEGLDGRTYRAARVSAPDDDNMLTADTLPTPDWWGWEDTYKALLVLRRAMLAENHAFFDAKDQGLPEDECWKQANLARVKILVRAQLWDPSPADPEYPEDCDPPDGRLEGLLARLASWLTPEGRELLHDDLGDSACYSRRLWLEELKERVAKSEQEECPQQDTG